MTIIIATKDANHEQPVEGHSGVYTTVIGAANTRVVGGPNKILLDGMIDAQRDLGQVTWTQLSENIARGWSYNSEHGGTNRVVVIDSDNAAGVDIIGAMNDLYRA